MYTNIPILFYDGSCGVCNGFVQWVLKNDKSGTIYFCSLQSEQTKKILSPYKEFEGVDDLNTLYFVKNNILYKRSKAIINILQTMKTKGCLLWLLKLVPAFISDIGYKCFANNRYWFKIKQCSLIEEKNKPRFI